MRETYTQLLSGIQKKQEREPIPKGIIYTYENIGSKLAYNPSVPFTIHSPSLQQDLRCMYVRVESPNSNWLDPTVPYDSQAVLYSETQKGLWKPVTEEMLGSANGLVFDNMEDPFISTIRGEIIFGGVVMEFPTDGKSTEKVPVESDAHFDYTKADVVVTTQFYRGKTISELRHFATIRHMKDIRLCELSDGSILIATHPQGGEAGIAGIGITRVKSLDDLTQETIDSAPVIKDLTDGDMKIGALALYPIPLDGSGDTGQEAVGIIGAIAYADENKDWHYPAIALKILNPYSFETEGIKHTPLDVIASRQNWTEGLSKRRQTKDVVFPAGIVREDDYTLLIAGLSDAQTGELVIRDPFAS